MKPLSTSTMKPLSTMSHLNLLTIFRNYGTLLHNAAYKDRSRPALQHEWQRWCRYDARLKTFSSLRLVNTNLTCTYQKEILEFFGEKPLSAKAHFEEKYPECVKPAFHPTAELEELVRRLKVMADKSRRSAWVSRVSVEAREANDAGWYMIFDTLSVNRIKELPLDERVFENGREWGKYVARIEEEVRKALGYKRHKPDGSGGPPRNTYARHFCRFEGGKDGKNPHAHVIWFLKDVPHEWKRDPNAGSGKPNKREINDMKKHWPWGWATPMPVRCHGDVWTDKHKWKWPCKKDGSEVPKRGPEVCGRYVAKYLHKGANADAFPWTHRVKATRGLGLGSLRKTLKEMPQRQLKGLAYPHIPSHTASQFLFQCSYSRSLLKREARSERVSRCLELKPSLVSSMILKSSSKKSLQSWYRGLKEQALQNLPKPWLLLREEFVEWLHKWLGTPIPISDKREIEACAYIAQRHPKPPRFAATALAGI